MQKASYILKSVEAEHESRTNLSFYSTTKHVSLDSYEKYKLTDEQRICVEAATEGKNLKIKAFAGSGKTSTLVEISKQLQGKGLYFAYNKTIQLDALKKFPAHVDCKTSHSLAYGANAHKIKGRLRTLNIIDIREHVTIEPIYNYEENDVAFLALKLLRFFANSDKKIIDKQFRFSSVFDTISGDKKEETEATVNYVISKAAEYWNKCWGKGSTLPIEHDFYLKLYQLSNPDLSSKYNFILFDECQDANPVLLDILSKQTCQKIYVGDEHQQIYSWRGSINAFSKLEGAEYYLSQSFRFGEKISELASIITWAKGEKKTLRGTKSIDSKIVEKNSMNMPFTVLSRTNARIIEGIIKYQRNKLHVVGGVEEVLRLAKSGYALFIGDTRNVRHFKLKQFKSWQSMLAFNHKYQDPDITFLAKLIKEHGDNFQNIIFQIENAHYVGEGIAEVTLSTIHKSKGREWDNVVLEDDFGIFNSELEIKAIVSREVEELNLIYVAVTRTKSTLLLTGGVRGFIKKLISYCKQKVSKEEFKDTSLSIECSPYTEYAIA